MSKREIPEINAGSMADIAFLLLIFFLVTTTMEREKAIIRQIPIPPDIEQLNQPPPPIVEERYRFDILANETNQVLVRNQLTSIESISDKLEIFYLQNREFGNKFLEYPNYQSNSDVEYEKELPVLIKEIADLEAVNNVTSMQFLDIKFKQLETAKKKISAIKKYREITGNGSIPEIDRQAHVLIEVMPKTSYLLMASIHAEIQEAIFNLRDKESKKLFDTPYASLRRKNDNDKNHLEGKEELYLLDLLFPENIIEADPTK
jgi:biopolymer transport protein ExbD